MNNHKSVKMRYCSPRANQYLANVSNQSSDLGRHIGEV